MYYKKLYFVTLVLLVICNHVTGKKSKKNKRPKEQEESSTIEPNVVAYSTFGFNDVGSYDGFVPTSPEYSSFLTGGNQESSTRLYAPAFPSAADSTGFSGNYESQSFGRQTLDVNKPDIGHTGMSQHTFNPVNFMSPTKSVNGEQNKNTIYENKNKQSAESADTPVYGTKINSRYKSRPNFSHSNPGYEVNEPSSNKYLSFQEDLQSQEKPLFSELNENYQNTNNYPSSTAIQETDGLGKFKFDSENNVINFPRVVDFTNLGTKYYPTDVETNKIITSNMQHLSQETTTPVPEMNNSFLNTYSDNKIIQDLPTRLTENFRLTNNEPINRNVYKTNTFFEPNFTNKHIASHYKDSETTTKKPEQKKKRIYRPWTSGNHSYAGKDWNDTKLSPSSVKGYEYSTNYSNMHFRYDVNEPKKPYNPDELVPASSNVVDLTYYRFPEKEYSNFKDIPKFNNDEDYFHGSYKEKNKPDDYLNDFKNSFNNVHTTTSSYWGNTFQATDYSSFRDHSRRPQYGVSENSHDNIVSITKKPPRLNFNKGITQNKQFDWTPSNYKQQKLSKPAHDWTKDFLDTKYKSEEDLLGLRTHDTSHPTYLPTYKPSNNVDNDDEFKQLVEKWKQSYTKMKYKNEPARDYESYSSEIKPYHVPISKPYPIELPHPVIVPVPRPFPVQVPISKPVVVPVLRELTVPIEKPVPYPVYKDVPYLIEKPVPVPVEKEVSVPVEKPYPVHIPYIRPVFHHTKPVYEDSEQSDEEDYPRRPEHKKPSHYKKRTVNSSRNKSRRPSRTSYQERHRRRSPDHRRPSGSFSEYRHSPRPSGFHHSSPYRHPRLEHHIDEDEHEYRMYCRNTGNC